MQASEQLLPIPTETLLTLNDSAALVGSYEGTVRTVVFSEVMEPEERKVLIKRNFSFSQPKHIPSVQKSIWTRHYGEFKTIVAPHTHFLDITKLEISLQSFEDKLNNLSVSAYLTLLDVNGLLQISKPFGNKLVIVA